MSRFGFLGLGIMGRAMAANLVKAGHEVTVWNRTPNRCAPLAELGAKVAGTPRDVVEACDITFAMLADPQAAQEVCFGDDGVLEGMSPGKGYVDMSTVDAETSRQIAEAVTEARGRFLEAPVSGTKKPAEDGTLIILCAGDKGLFDEAGPGLSCMGKKILYLGEVGQGARMKLVVNMIMGGMMAVFCEGLALGEKGGLDPATILEVLDAGALSNPMFRGKGALMLKKDYAPNFPLKHMQKDLRLAVSLGDELAQPLHSAAAANESFKAARRSGLADQDFCALYDWIRKDS